jgi:hypothetical protein
VREKERETPFCKIACTHHLHAQPTPNCLFKLREEGRERRKGERERE